MGPELDGATADEFREHAVPTLLLAGYLESVRLCTAS